MHIRTVVAIAALLLPAGLSAQRLPTPGNRRPRPSNPVPLPPQPEPIARHAEYTRLHVSVGSYPLLSHVQTSTALDGGASAWTTLGAGSRVEYRFARLAAATLDLTSSLVGGPVMLQTAELGTRLGPERSVRRLDPFVDLRVGYLALSSRGVSSSLEDPFGFPTAPGKGGSRYSRGWGGVAGVGLEYGLTPTFSLTTALLATHNRMTSRDVLAGSIASTSFGLTSVRYTVGLRYNPVRTILH
jgi:hypothetical protein